MLFELWNQRDSDENFFDKSIKRINNTSKILLKNIPKSIILSYVSNLVALWAASRWVSGFAVSNDLRSYLWVAAILTLLNIFIRPILKLVLTPIIILTLGLGIIIVNMIIVFILSNISSDVTLGGIEALFFTSLIISFVNFSIHFFLKKPQKIED